MLGVLAPGPSHPRQCSFIVDLPKKSVTHTISLLWTLPVDPIESIENLESVENFDYVGRFNSVERLDSVENLESVEVPDSKGCCFTF